MSIGLIGVNPITQIVASILNESHQKMVIYDDAPHKIGQYFFDTLVKGNIDLIETDFNNKELAALHICLGEKHLNLKKKIFQKYIDLGLEFPNIIHNTSILASTAKISKGNMLSFGVIVGHNTNINSNNSIWAGTVIEHDCTLHGHSYIGPNVTISGFVEVGECSLIGSGAVVLPEIKIGKNCIIGAGSVVTKNVPDNTIVKGNPAR